MCSKKFLRQLCDRSRPTVTCSSMSTLSREHCSMGAGVADAMQVCTAKSRIIGVLNQHGNHLTGRRASSSVDLLLFYCHTFDSDEAPTICRRGHTCRSRCACKQHETFHTRTRGGAALRADTKCVMHWQGNAVHIRIPDIYGLRQIAVWLTLVEPPKIV